MIFAVFGSSPLALWTDVFFTFITIITNNSNNNVRPISLLVFVVGLVYTGYWSQPGRKSQIFPTWLMQLHETPMRVTALEFCWRTSSFQHDKTGVSRLLFKRWLLDDGFSHLKWQTDRWTYVPTDCTHHDSILNKLRVIKSDRRSTFGRNRA